MAAPETRKMPKTAYAFLTCRRMNRSSPKTRSQTRRRCPRVAVCCGVTSRRSFSYGVVGGSVGVLTSWLYYKRRAERDPAVILRGRFHLRMVYPRDILMGPMGVPVR